MFFEIYREQYDAHPGCGGLDAFGSKEQTLHANNMGGHTGIPQFARQDAAAFFARHPRADRPSAPLC
ncbi:hypothetical protein [Micromonospora sagamiensis]|uniref:Uncharacterized protein n=1 Tax=Micromonospora sagamiensis TaxID=47875 RepID=A0A562WK95_9ACTN|nr:hypothetical protein [Micromonospora sagamiensis]TWJ30461.1 hypothetical protein JD81_04001 [Micromonospora sagamiensis]BCL16508.1 hypothetical protein GCM10017556_42470 [Micromonospora sagamiensis]